MRTPWRLPEQRDTTIVVGLVGICLAATVFMAVIGQPLVNATTPNGIISFELARSYDAAAAILASWDEAARSVARVQTLWDYFLYIPTYVIAFVSWADWCVRRLSRRWLAGIGVLLAWAMLPAGVFDMIENWQMLGQLEDGADGARAAIAATCAWIKFAIVYTTFAYLVFATIGIASVKSMKKDGAV